MVLFDHTHSRSFEGMTGRLKPLFEAGPSVPAFAALVLLWIVLTLAGLGIAPLFDYDEASYAQTAVEMRKDRNWLLPTLNGRPYYDKPAFLYYCMNASFALFGKNAFAARLPSSLFTLVTAFFLLHVGRRLGRPETGMKASLIYLSMLMPALLAHAAILDAALNFFIVAAALGFFLWQHSAKRSDAFLAMLAAGVAVSVKGPVGMIIPALVVCLDRLLARTSSRVCAVFPGASASRHSFWEHCRGTRSLPSPMVSVFSGSSSFGKMCIALCTPWKGMAAAGITISRSSFRAPCPGSRGFRGG